MVHHEGSPAPETDGAQSETMYENFTDAENTGAPLVPMCEESPGVAADGGTQWTAEYEEVILSHRLSE